MKSIQLLVTLFYSSFLLISSCSGDETLEEVKGTSKQTKVTFQLRAQGPEESINVDDEDREDWFTNVVLVGSPFKGEYEYGVSEEHTLEVDNVVGKRDFLFVANLTEEDQKRFGSTATDDDFNRLELSTEDYLDSDMNFQYIAPVMSAIVKNVPPGNETSNIPVKFKRLFAKVNYNFLDGPWSKSNIDYVQEIKVCNVPGKFTIGGPIANYDLKHKLDPENYPYLEYIFFPSTDEELKGSIYLPEHFVSAPAFWAPDSHSMTYIEVRFMYNRFSITRKYRIGGVVPYTASYGQIQRNKELTIVPFAKKRPAEYDPYGWLN